ncbi:hypothetical protein M409DRAFT_56874 [Zasmidium cellare ATCC 36951]|uniref:GST N-terminal domain-containing protein n=1 Tax=Zasmidium cellare ATCC 36951 TaxID=1080233 RepID=A0A6A6CAX1_ZASCE|nr:uncharacterized protein M409DRAFT_56874 [Zasmidium cellare ATCC 36951]KAF2164175.1 hypothetical protein M409DRAFT_56874 [Zasmidium cellare ATCC 36951]
MSGQSERVIFYDLPSKGEPHCFSPNAWKTRAALNFKGLNYSTDWTDFCDLHEKLISFGLAPNDPDECIFRYSSPTIQLPDGSYVMESRHIADALEKLQPEPSLRLDTGYPERAQGIVDLLLRTVVVPFMYRIPDWLLRPEGAKWYHQERQKLFGGMTLYDFAEHEEFSGERAWQKAEPAMNDLRNLLAENQTGPFVMGSQVSYADFIIVSYFKFLTKIDKDGDAYGRMVGFDPSFEALFKACEKWYARDEH